MDLYSYLKLSTEDKIRFCNKITQEEIDADPETKLIHNIFVNLIESCKRLNFDLIRHLHLNLFKIPSYVIDNYIFMEGSVLSNLPYNKYEAHHHRFQELKLKVYEENKMEKQRVFELSKARWCKEFPDFAEIFRIVNLHMSSELLIEFGKKSISDTLLKSAFKVFKKTISFKTSGSEKKLIKGLTSSKYPHRNYNYCINEKMAHAFQDAFLDWAIEIGSLWHSVYYFKEDFFNNAGYDRTSWETYIKYPTMLKQKREEIERMTNKAIFLMNSGAELIDMHNLIITKEYEQNRTEMSLFEREKEIAALAELFDQNDEQYCYVYTLECELFVFYVGIASDPKARYEQHIRGAFSDEAHLFKSKFIQKYHSEVKQKIVFEGTRRECKIFERNYIAKHMPLGYMTEGGEG
mgnify:CR=1 FL=1